MNPIETDAPVARLDLHAQDGRPLDWRNTWV